TTEGSPFKGKQSPNLVEMFLRGANGQAQLGITGGRDTIPTHAHYFSASTNSVMFGIDSGNGNIGSYSPNNQAAGGGWDNSQLVIAKTPKEAGNPYQSHGHMNGEAYVSGSTYEGGGADNRPRFTSVHFILRVK